MFIGSRNLTQFFFVFLCLNIVLAVYETADGSRRRPVTSNNQRSADSGYKYAWFTRDIHDDAYSDEDGHLHRQHLPPQGILNMKMLANMINRKYPKHDDVSSESNEKP